MDDPSAHLQPSLTDLETWSNEQQESFRQQIAANEIKTANKENSRSLSEEALKKRKEREERKRLAAQKLALEADIEDINATTPTIDPSEGMARERAIHTAHSTMPDESASSTNYVITIPAASEYSWYSPDRAVFATIEAAQKEGIWTYPSNLNERARCGVFRGLWEQGYFMGSGIKFGGDYLVYPGLSYSSVNIWETF